MIWKTYRRCLDRVLRRAPREGQRSQFFRPLTEQLESRELLATLMVNSLADNSIAGNGLVTLREAIFAANNDSTTDLGAAGSGADTIVFDPSLTAGGDQTLTVSVIGDTTAGPSAFGISSAVTIIGPTGNNGLTLSGAGTTQRLFYVAAAGNLTLDSLTLAGGMAKGGNGGTGGGGGGAGLGGAIFNMGSLTLRSSTLSGNTAQGGDGGGLIFTYGGAGGGMGGNGAINIGGGPNGGSYPAGPGGFGGGGGRATYITGGNGGFGGGGGSSSQASGGNGGFGGGAGAGNGNGSAGFGGGGAGSFRSGGGAGLGGAIFNAAGTVTITNSTLSANTASGGAARSNQAFNGSGLGGAVFNLNGTLNLQNSTLAGNTVNGGTAQPLVGSADGGAVYTLGLDNVWVSGTRSGATVGTAAGAQVLAVNSIFANSLGGTNDFLSNNATVNAASANNRIVNGATPAGFTSTTTALLGLGSLQDNGGPTNTMALGVGSSAIDSISSVDSTQAPYSLTSDQRGGTFARKVGSAVDVGAVEAGSFNVTASNPVALGASTTGTAGSEQTFTVSGLNLIGGLTFTPPTGVEISSTSGSGFSNTLTLAPSGGLLGTTTVYVRIAASAAVGLINGLIAVSSNFLTTQNVTVSGEVHPVAPTGVFLQATSDLGSSNSDGVTRDNTPTIEGTTTPNYRVNVYDNAGPLTFLGFTTADGTGKWTFTRSAALTDGNHSLITRSIDPVSLLASFGFSAAVSVTIDTVAPTINANFTSAPASTGWYNIATGAPVYAYTASDNAGGSGLDSPATGSFTFGEGFLLTHTFNVTDLAGNSASVTSPGVKVDLTAPTVGYNATQRKAGVTTPYTLGTWTNADRVDVAATGSDANGLNTFTIAGTTSEGIRSSVFVLVGDPAGNTASMTVGPVQIDRTAPSTTATVTGTAGANGTYTSSSVSVSLNPSDALSGIGSTSYSLDGGAAQAYSGAFTVSGDGPHNVTYFSTDVAANVETTKTLTLNINSAPPDIALSNTSIAENLGANAVVGNLTSTDATPNDTVTFSLPTFGDNTQFNIFNSAGTIQLRANSSFNFEAKQNYSVKIVATDFAGNTSEKLFSISVTDVNEPPTFNASTSTFNVAEEGTTTVGTVGATDPENNVLTYSFGGGVDDGRFNINASTGAVTFKNVPDFELPADNGGNNVYDVQVRVTDGTNAAVTQNVTVTVTNVIENRAPTVDSLSVLFVALEGSTFNTTVNFTDPDGNNSPYMVTIDWGDGTTPSVYNNATSGQSFSHVYVNGDNNYTQSVTVADSFGAASAAFTRGIAVINSAPFITGLVYPATVDEGSLFSVQVNFGDNGVNDTHSLTINWGDGSSNVYNTVVSGQSYTHTFENGPMAPQIDFQVGDNGTTNNRSSHTLTNFLGFNLFNVLNAAPVVATPTFLSPTILEGGLASFSFSFSDAGVTDTHSATIDWGDGTTSTFIPAATANAVITRTHIYNVNLTTPTAPFTVSVSVNDNDGATGMNTALLTVNAVNNAPTAVITPTSYNATEQTAENLKNTGLAVNDSDAGNGIVAVNLAVTEGTLTVTAGGSGATVTDSGTSNVTITGTITQINALLASDGSSTVSYFNGLDAPSTSATLTLSINDNGNTGGGNLSAADTAIINITAVNDPLVFNGASFEVAENSVNGTEVGTLTANDPDGPSLTWSIVGGDTGLTFAIDPATGTLSVFDNAVLDFETNPVFTLTVSVTDGEFTRSGAVTINLTNVNEPPRFTSAGPFSIAERSPNGSTVGQLTGADPDAGTTLRFSITGGNTSGAFAIDPDNGTITVANRTALDFAVNPTFALTAQLSDGDRFVTAQVSVNVVDVPEFDFGDAPESYGVAQHGEGTASTPLLGTRDAEESSYFSATATGDDATGSDDEDGVTFSSTTLVPRLNTNITVNASAAGKLDAWIDFNRNGMFDANEKIASALSVVAGNNGLVVSVPDGLTTGTTFARFRISTLGSALPTGLAADGEVEDYQLSIVSVPQGTAQLVSDPANPTGPKVLLINGNDNINDAIVVRQTTAPTTLPPNPGAVTVYIAPQIAVGSFALNSFGSIVIFGRSGNDSIVIESPINKPSTIYGDAGNDTISGGLGPDIIYPGDGNDNVAGNAGNDVIYGSLGNDSLAGGADFDRFIELPGSVTLTQTTSKVGTSSDSLSTIEQVELTGTPGADTYQLTSVNLAVLLDAGGGNDTLAYTGDGNVVVSDTQLTRTQGTATYRVPLATIENLRLMGGNGNESFDITQFSKSLILSGGVGTDTIVATNDVDYQLSDTALLRTGLPVVAHSTFENAQLTGGASDNNFSLSGWTKTATLNGGGGKDKLVVADNVSTTLTNTSLNRTGRGTIALTSIEAAELTDGAGSNTINAASFSGELKVDGGAGNDTITGAAGPTLILGGLGNDTLKAGTGRTVLIGGDGLDKLTGNINDDLLIAGQTAHDANAAALALILAEWASAASYLDRVTHLTTATTGLNGAARLDGANITHDASVDVLLGGGGIDLFFAKLASTVGSPMDTVSDKISGESIF